MFNVGGANMPFINVLVLDVNLSIQSNTFLSFGNKNKTNKQKPPKYERRKR